MSASQGRFAGRGNTAGRPGGRHSYRNITAARTSLQQAQDMQNSFDSNNRFSCLAEGIEDRMDTGLLDLSQAQLEEAFKDDLPGDILEIEPTGINRMDITATTDAQDMSGLVVNNSMTVTPTSTRNPYLSNTSRVRQQPTSVERPGGVEEAKVEMEPMEIPGLPTPTGSHWKHFTRLDVILQVSPVGDSATAVSRALSEMLQGVFNGTKTKFEIFPWKVASKSHLRIRSAKHVPTNPDKLLEFCHDLYLPSKNVGGRRYFKIWVGTDKTFHTYKEEAKPWLTRQNWSIFESVLQVEQSVTLGWFYGSHGDINRSTLARAILKTTGVQVGLKYRAVVLPNDKVKGKPTPTAPKVPIRAIQIKIDKESPTYENDLAKIWSAYATGSSFPLNLEFRLVPMAAGLVDPRSGPKLQALRKSQEKFASKLKSLTSSDIVSLDKEIDKGITLRERILALRPQDKSRSDRLFKGVDHHFANHNLVTFTCLQKDGDEAMALINSLLPRLLRVAETSTMKFHLPTCFSADAQFAAVKIQVNNETGELQTHEDQMIEAIIEMDWGSDEESVSSKKSVSFSAKSAPSAATSTGASEVSSFGSKTFKRLIKETARKEDDNQSLSESSSSSEATTVTSNKSKDSRTSSLSRETSEPKKMEGMAKDILKYIKEQFEAEREEGRRLRQTNNEEFQRQREQDKQEILELKAQLLMQVSPQRSTHQPTDTAALDDPYTPTGRQPHGSDATLTDPSEVSGVGRSL